MTENSGLSEREIEILKLVATGASNKEIARDLSISTNTVKVHLRNIFAKIGAASRTEAAMYAVNNRLVMSSEVSFYDDATLDTGDVSTESPQRTSNLNIRVLFTIGFLLIAILGIGGYVLWQNTNDGSSSAILPTPSPWLAHAPLPVARSGLAVAEYDGMLYAIGGTTTENVTGRTDRYDPGTNNWIELQQKPTAVTDIGAAVIAGKIYVPGGKLSSGIVTDRFEVYDPHQGQWQSAASIPVPMSGYAIAAFEGKIYIFGGWDGNDYLDSVYEYHPDQDTWHTMPPMPTKRAWAGAAVAGRKIYVLGGYDGERALTVSEVFLPEQVNGSSNNWSTSIPLIEGRYAMGIASLADTIYIVGGKGGPFEYPAMYYSNAIPEWQPLQAPQKGGYSHFGMVNLATYLYMLGGLAENAPSDTNMSYQAMYTLSIPIITK